MTRLTIEHLPPLASLSGRDQIEGKFLQLRWQDNDYLLFASRDSYRFHNQMLARFLANHALPHHWRDEATLEFDLPRLRVVGGGRFRFTRETQRLELWDESQAYGRFEEAGLVERIRASGHLYGQGEITIC
jgi:hypothetical protein